jgi:hypothetical protein
MFVHDGRIECTDIGLDPRHNVRLGYGRTHQLKRASLKQNVGGGGRDDAHRIINGTASHTVYDIVVHRQVICAPRVGTHVNEPMTLEARQAVKGVLNQVTMKYIATG